MSASARRQDSGDVGWIRGALAPLLRELGARSFLALGAGFAFTPIVAVNSVCTMDYLVALAFLLGSALAIVRRRALAAGLLLGLAIGARLSVAAMLLPLALWLWGELDGARRARAVSTSSSHSSPPPARPRLRSRKGLPDDEPYPSSGYLTVDLARCSALCC